MNEERRRARIAEEVAEAEHLAEQGLSSYTDVELEAMNQQLDKLRNEATSLKMPTRRIDQLKLQVSSSIGGAHKPQRTQQKGPGPRGKEKVRPFKKKGAGWDNTSFPISPATQERLERTEREEEAGEQPTAIPANSPAGEKIRQKIEEQGEHERAEETAKVIGECPHCKDNFIIPTESIVQQRVEECPHCELQAPADAFINQLVEEPEGKKSPSRKGQGGGVKAQKPKPKPGSSRRAMSELFGQ